MPRWTLSQLASQLGNKKEDLRLRFPWPHQYVSDSPIGLTVYIRRFTFDYLLGRGRGPGPFGRREVG